jgi:hypothetical protein
MTTSTIPPFTTLSGNSFVSEFPDVQSFIHACQRPTCWPKSNCSSYQGDKYFCGSESMEEAEQLLLHGVPELERKISELAQEITDASGSTVPAMVMQYAEVGEMVDIGMYLTGEPACMMYAEETRQAGIRIIKLGLNCSVHAGTSKTAIMLKGAAFCVLCDALERAGYRVEIAVTEGTKPSGKFRGGTGFIRIPVKNAAEPLDMARLAYILAHPSFLRRHIFRFQETLPEIFVQGFGYSQGKGVSGYGQPADDPAFAEGCDIYLQAESSFFDVRDARKWVKTQIQRFTTPA